MRQGYIVTYDIRDAKRLHRVHRLMRGYGRHLQLSVFHCELDASRRIEVEVRLRAEIHHGEDQVLFIDLGPADGRAEHAIESLGRAYVRPERSAVVV